MENFTIYNPVRVHFGKDVLDKLGATVSSYGKKVLLVYGQGSIHRNGVYDKVMEQLSAVGCSVWEYHGIRSNR
jgi:alcohol dehydrogenase YqhD (iron-dependent ADH family)